LIARGFVEFVTSHRRAVNDRPYNNTARCTSNSSLSEFPVLLPDIAERKHRDHPGGFLP